MSAASSPSSSSQPVRARKFGARCGQVLEGDDVVGDGDYFGGVVGLRSHRPGRVHGSTASTAAVPRVPHFANARLAHRTPDRRPRHVAAGLRQPRARAGAGWRHRGTGFSSRGRSAATSWKISSSTQTMPPTISGRSCASRCGHRRRRGWLAIRARSSFMS